MNTKLWQKQANSAFILVVKHASILLMNKELQVELIPEVKMHAIHGLDHVPTGKAHAME